MAQLNMLEALRRHARPPAATPLLQVLARYAEFVGWLQQDAGDLPAAMYWSDVSIRSSRPVVVGWGRSCG